MVLPTILGRLLPSQRLRSQLDAEARAKRVVHHPLDHDRNGKAGGSLPAAERGLNDLRKEYERLAGKPADGRWGERRLAAKIAALR